MRNLKSSQLTVIYAKRIKGKRFTLFVFSGISDFWFTYTVSLSDSTLIWIWILASCLHVANIMMKTLCVYGRCGETLCCIDLQTFCKWYQGVLLFDNYKFDEIEFSIQAFWALLHQQLLIQNLCFHNEKLHHSCWYYFSEWPVM